MKLSVSLLRLLFSNYRHRCRIDVPAREKKVWFDFHRVLYHLPAHQLAERTLLFVICVQINVPLLTSNNYCFRGNWNFFFHFLFFFNFCFLAVTWSYPVCAEGDLQRQMRQEFISVFLTRWAASAAEAKAVPSVLAGFSGSQATERISLRHQLIERRADLLTWRMFSHPERKSWCANRAKLLPQGCPLSLTVLSRCLLWSVPWLTRGSLEQRLKEQKETASRIGRSFFLCALETALT